FCLLYFPLFFPFFIIINKFPKFIHLFYLFISSYFHSFNHFFIIKILQFPPTKSFFLSFSYHFHSFSQMGSSQNLVFPIKTRHLLISLLLCFSSSFFVQGRQISESNVVLKGQEEKVIERALIGSSPPRCEGRCRNCGHCEAIQVPIIPQQGFPRNHFIKSIPRTQIAYSRGDSLSNYKPMSWKCKCGDTIFNP
ncbi:hypothetical protein KSS87_023377, partial [Heliosperma pusillum]